MYDLRDWNEITGFQGKGLVEKELGVYVDHWRPA